MNARLEAKLNMYRSVEQLCNNNSSITSLNTAFQTAFNDFTKTVGDIQMTATAESQVITGITEDKSADKNTLCYAAIDVAAIVYAYASTTGNSTLKRQVDFSVSDLLKQKDDLLVPVCVNIYNAANDNLTELEPYGITPGMLTALQTNIDNYNDAVPKPKTAKAVKQTSGTNLKTLFKEADAILKERMDKLKNIFKKDNPDFVTSYKNARVIIDPKQIKTKTAA